MPTKRVRTAITLAVIASSVFLLAAGVGLMGQVGWFLLGCVVSLALATTGLLIGAYVPKRGWADGRAQHHNAHRKA
jgi:hypothetical protein